MPISTCTYSWLYQRDFEISTQTPHFIVVMGMWLGVTDRACGLAQEGRRSMFISLRPTHA
jgi:hypothetical protein